MSRSKAATSPSLTRLCGRAPSATPIDLSFSLPPVADGLSSSQATSINANGVIVGWAASRTTGDTVATIWTPTAVPLPKTSLIGE